MTHEFTKIVASFEKAKKNNKKCVLATVVDLEGSAYRRPGVRMLITRDGEMTGAISGGCVEKEVIRESASVFSSGIAKIIKYDGRYRLGCDGGIYILIEIFNPSDQFLDDFTKIIENRLPFSASMHYSRKEIADKSFGTLLDFSGNIYPANQNVNVDSFTNNNQVFNQDFPPMFQLVIFGGEHDAAKLTIQASLLGWQVILVTSPFDGYTTKNFPGSYKVLQATANQVPKNLIDQNTAVVMMTHNYSKDLSYLLAIKDIQPFYLGWLGPVKRKNKLFDDIIEHNVDVPKNWIDVIFGPAGLDLGAESAEEIALSICSEITAIRRGKEAYHLRDIKGSIHKIPNK